MVTIGELKAFIAKHDLSDDTDLAALLISSKDTDLVIDGPYRGDDYANGGSPVVGIYGKRKPR